MEPFAARVMSPLAAVVTGGLIINPPLNNHLAGRKLNHRPLKFMHFKELFLQMNVGAV